MGTGIVYDGVTIRYMTPRERALWRARWLPPALTVIVAPALDSPQDASGIIIPPNLITEGIYAIEGTYERMGAGSGGDC